MKIMYVYDAIARIGGVERILVDKMNYLAEVYGHDVYLITSSQGKHPFSFPLSDKVKHQDINARFHLQYQYGHLKRWWMKWKLDRAFRRNLEKVVQEMDPDIIVGVVYFKADVICKLKCRAKKVIESHCAKSYTGQNDGVERNRLTQWLCRYRLNKYNRTVERKSDAIVTLTRGDATEWDKKDNISIIPNMITKELGRQADCEVHRAVSAGRLIYQKGYDQLIETWGLVHERHPDWKLDIFGNGQLREKLEQQIIRKQLENAVNIHPPTPHIMEEFLESSIYVMSSNYEGFPLVLTEAMNCGLPCVSYDYPYGASDIICHGEDGILVEKGNIPQLAENICRLIENETLRKTYGKKAASNIKRLRCDIIMKQWESLFESLI